MMSEPQRVPDRGTVLAYVVGILEDATATLDWDVGPIHPETRLGDPLPDSISTVFVVGEIQTHFGLHDRLFQRLRASNTTVMDLCVADLVDLVCDLLGIPSQAVGSQR
jgi:hypothetical protein